MEPLSIITKDPEHLALVSLKAKLLLVIRQRYEQQKFKQEQLADRLGIYQPRVSDLLNGRIEMFSVDTLVTYAVKLGFGLSFDLELHEPTIPLTVRFDLVGSAESLDVIQE